MKIIEKQPRKVVVAHNLFFIVWATFLCFFSACFFILLDAKHPKASLSCVRHQIDVSEEDNDCELLVRPTRTVFDTHLRTQLYSFEISSAKFQVISGSTEHVLEFNGSKDARKQLEELQEGLPSPSRSVPQWAAWFYQKMGFEPNEAFEEASDLKPATISSHLKNSKSNSLYFSVAPHYRILLESKEGEFFTFYDFQDFELAKDMLNRVLDYLQDSRSGKEQIQLNLDYDDSYWDEAGAIVSILLVLFFSWSSFREVVVFDSELGVMRMEYNNLWRQTRQSYTCALDNVARAEVTAVMIFDVVAGRPPTPTLGSHTNRQHGLRLVLCRPFWERCTMLEHVNGSYFLKLGFGTTIQEEGSLRCIAEAINDMLLTYVREEDYVYQKGVSGAEGIADEKANMLGASLNSSGQVNCCICTQRKARVVFFPCKHINTCVICSEFISNCPVCRDEIYEKHTVYF